MILQIHYVVLPHKCLNQTNLSRGQLPIVASLCDPMIQELKMSITLRPAAWAARRLCRVPGMHVPLACRKSFLAQCLRAF